MADGFWPGRRVFVTGSTGFLGGWLLKSLLARGADILALVRDPHRDGDFFRDKLHQRVHVVRGRAEDAERLRSLFRVHDIQTAFPLAATEGSSLAFTRTLIAAAPARCRVVVPVRPGLVARVHSATGPEVTFVRTPHLFGAGDRRTDSWPVRLFLAAARGEALPPVERGEYLHARDAAEGLLDIAERLGGLHADLPPAITARELFDFVCRADAGVPAETVAWYRSADLVAPPIRRPRAA